MFVVSHYRLCRTCPFDTLDEAKEFCRRAGYDAAIRHNGKLVARYSAAAGWSVR